MQIEYRLFADYSKSERLIRVYDENPLASFHESTHAMIVPHQPSFSYDDQKNLNFAKIYGAGLRKMGWMLNFITFAQFTALMRDKEWRKSPLMQNTIAIEAIYNREIPEAKPLLDRARGYAETRGWVKTIKGRRSRFKQHTWDEDKGSFVYHGEANRSHKALNAVIQGSAADIMKQKLIELHKTRHETGFLLRFTVHDEVDGDAPDRKCITMVNALLNRQSFDLKVPILWEVGSGPNWADQTDEKPIYTRAA
jgi:DNA polymerase I